MKIIFLVLLCISFNAQAMVVSSRELANQAGERVLKQGGNAIDAAVAVGYALAVVDPANGNIGGGGFMLIHKARKNIFIDFRETAPAKIKASLFFNKNGKLKNPKHNSYLYVGVPGTVLGLNTALKKYGKLTLQQDMQPAIALAKTRNPDLARTLTLISKKGSVVFYDGSIARKIVNASDKHGGVLSLQDFKHYKVIFRKPFVCDYRGYHIVTAPPPGSGLVVCRILTAVAKYPLRKWGFHSVKSVVANVNAMQKAFAYRNKYLADPANERPETTHYAVSDKHGNIVSVTYTLNGRFGTGLIAGNTGFYLNDELDDFTLKVGRANMYGLKQGAANLIAPGKRPASSMSPTIIFKKQKAFMTLGAAGGSTIITTVTQIIENVIDYDMSIQRAVDAPRYHMQNYPNVLFYEPGAFSKLTLKKLKQKGYHLKEGWLFKTKTWGKAAAITFSQGKVIGAADKR